MSAIKKKSQFNINERLNLNCDLFPPFFCLFCVCYVLCCTDIVIKHVKTSLPKPLFSCHVSALSLSISRRVQFPAAPQRVIRDLRGGDLLRAPRHRSCRGAPCMEEMLNHYRHLALIHMLKVQHKSLGINNIVASAPVVPRY